MPSVRACIPAMAHGVILFMVVVVFMLAGCGRGNALTVTPTAVMSAAAVPASAPTPDIRGVDPQVVFAKLTATEQLVVAAAQLAAALDVPTEAVRARLQPGGCTLCDLESNQGVAEVAGLDVDAAAEALAPDDGVYLFVGQLTCFYKFDGSILTPQSCQQAPL